MHQPILLYRYYHYSYCEGYRVSLAKYKTVKEMPCGYWFIRDYDYDRYMRAQDEEDKLLPSYIKVRWVSKTARKRYCYPTQEEALVNLIKRKQRQIFLLELQLTNAKQALKTAEEMKRGKSLDEARRTCEESGHIFE